MEETQANQARQPEDETDSLNFFSSGAVKIVRSANNTPTVTTTLTRNPFLIRADWHGNSVQTVRKETAHDEVDAVIEMIEKIKLANTPRGLVLNKSVVTQRSTVTSELSKVKEVLGKGNSAGEVFLVEDHGTNKDYARKQIMLSQFNKDEIKAWVHLHEEGRAPELYHFELRDNKVIMSMEVMEGKTLQEVVESGTLTDPSLTRSFSLLLLHNLLDCFDILKEGGYTHGDMHGGNVMVSPSLEIKLFDFGLARSKLRANVKHMQRLKADIVGILRMFCFAYTRGIDFNDYDAAEKALKSNNFREISQYMAYVPEADRKELFTLMARVFDSVREERQEQYGETQAIARDVEAKLPTGEELDNIKKRLAVMLFPDKYKSPYHDPEFVPECENDEFDGNPLLDDPNLADLATLVNLRDFGDTSLF